MVAFHAALRSSNVGFSLFIDQIRISLRVELDKPSGWQVTNRKWVEIGLLLKNIFRRCKSFTEIISPDNGNICV